MGVVWLGIHYILITYKSLINIYIHIRSHITAVGFGLWARWGLGFGRKPKRTILAHACCMHRAHVPRVGVFR